MNSAYSIFKRPSTLDNAEPFLEVVLGIPGAGHYTPNLAQEINLSRNQRQLIADKGSFDGGACTQANLELSHAAAVTSSLQLLLCLEANRYMRMPDKISRAWATFRAALTGRRINVDRVSIRVMWRAVYATKLTFYGLARAIVRVPLSIVIHRFESCHDSNADSYSRCFRYLDCFDVGLTHFRRFNRASRADIQSGPSIKAVYLSSQLDRKTDFARQDLPLTVTALADFTGCHGTVCGTQTKQGGCLYEQPCSQNYGCVAQRQSGVSKLLDTWLRKVAKIVYRILDRATQELLGSSPATTPFWQKPGIGVRPSVRSSSLKALPRGKDNRVLTGCFDGGRRICVNGNRRRFRDLSGHLRSIFSPELYATGR